MSEANNGGMPSNDSEDVAYHLAIEEFPGDAVTCVKASIKSGLFRETMERKTEIVKKLADYLNTIYQSKPIEVIVAQEFENTPVPHGGFYLKAHPALPAHPGIPQMGIPPSPAREAREKAAVVLDKPSLVSFLASFAKHLMIQDIAGWENNNPDIFFPIKFSHSLFYRAAPNSYMKALTEGRLILPRKKKNEGAEGAGNE